MDLLWLDSLSLSSIGNNTEVQLQFAEHETSDSPAKCHRHRHKPTTKRHKMTVKQL